MGRHPRQLTEVGGSLDGLLRAGLVASLVNGATALAVPLLSLPILLGALGNEQYGLWVTVAAVAAVLGVLDLGVGNAALTQIASAADAQERARAIKAMYLVAGGVSAAVLCAWIVLSGLTDVADLLGADGVPRAGALVHLAIVSATLSLPALLIYKVQIGLGRQASSHLTQATAACLVAAGLLGLTFLDADSFLMLVLVACLPAAVALVYTAGVLDFRRVLGVSLRGLEVSPVSKHLRMGIPIFAVTILMMLAQSLDLLLVGRSLGYDAVPEYSVPYRIFTAVGSVAVMLAGPLWALNATALSRGDIAWVRRKTRSVALGVTVGVGLTAIFCLAAGDWILGAVLAGAVSFDLRLWSIMALTVTLQAASGPYFMVQNSVAAMKIQMVVYGFACALLPVKFLALKSAGLVGFSFALLLIQALLILPAAVYGARRVMSEREAATCLI